MKRLLFILAIVVLSLAILAPLTGAFVVGSGLLALAVVVAGLAEGTSGSPKVLKLQGYPWSVEVSLTDEGELQFNATDGHRSWHMASLDRKATHQLFTILKGHFDAF